jgi:CheY-like chemotaxis protein/HPt (histidine-containing phosphotransfer) domain-containing protein
LAEDNRVNQGFAIEILEGLGIAVTLAVNGKEALEKAQAQPFDIILMDCQMPVMDGFEASTLLNELKNSKKISNVPIIALTANAMKGDKERCLAAGMNDYISKPMRKLDIINGLAKWLPTDLVRQSGGSAGINAAADNVFNKPQILLVEDNRVNREFAVEMLENMGCLVTTAENGKVSLQKARNGAFDLVLMDVQMPIMDGFEATTMLRQMSDSNEIMRWPIVALTANAMKGDKEKCLTAGMDDYLTKPVVKQQLADMLRRWLPEDKRHGAAAPAVEDAQASAIDRNILEQMRELMHTKFIVFVKLYLEDMQFYLDKLEQLAQNARPSEDAIIYAHTIKSASGCMGALQVAAIAEKIEMRASDLAKNGADASSLLAYVLQLGVTYGEARQQLQKYIATQQEAA